MNTRMYPLEIESIGEDVYKLMSRGHHDIHAFQRKFCEVNGLTVKEQS